MLLRAALQKNLKRQNGDARRRRVEQLRRCRKTVQRNSKRLRDRLDLRPRFAGSSCDFLSCITRRRKLHLGKNLAVPGRDRNLRAIEFLVHIAPEENSCRYWWNRVPPAGHCHSRQWPPPTLAWRSARG